MPRAMKATLGVWLGAALAAAPAAAEQDQKPKVPAGVIVTCASKPGERTDCPADTSKGVALGRSSGEAPCLLGKSWGYDDHGIWVSDGCSAEFVVGQALSEAVAQKEPKRKPLDHIPNIGFLLVEG